MLGKYVLHLALFPTSMWPANENRVGRLTNSLFELIRHLLPSEHRYIASVHIAS